MIYNLIKQSKQSKPWEFNTESPLLLLKPLEETWGACKASEPPSKMLWEITSCSHTFKETQKRYLNEGSSKAGEGGEGCSLGDSSKATSNRLWEEPLVIILSFQTDIWGGQEWETLYKKLLTKPTAPMMRLSVNVW